MRITNQMLVNQLKKIAERSAPTGDGQGMKVGSAFTAKVANIYNGLLTLELAPRTYIEARDTTGAQYTEGDVLDFVVTDQDESGKIYIKALTPEAMEQLQSKELQNLLAHTNMPATDENMEIAKHLMLQKLPLTEANVKLIADAKAHFTKVITLANDQALVLTEDKLNQAVKDVLINQYKQMASSNTDQQASQNASEVSKSDEAAGAKTQFSDMESAGSKDVLGDEKEAVDLKATSLKTLESSQVQVPPKGEALQAAEKQDEQGLLKVKNSNSSIEESSLGSPVKAQSSDRAMVTDGDSSRQSVEPKITSEQLRSMELLVKDLNPEKLVFLLKNQLSFSINNAMQMEKLIVGKDQLTDQLNQLVQELQKDGKSDQLTRSLQSVIKSIEVTDFYDKEKVESQLKSLGEMLEKTAEATTQREGSETARTQLTDIRQSVDFLNQLNDQITYIQVPVMLNNQQNNLEIFVQRDQSGKKQINPRDTRIFISLNTNHLDLVQVLVEVKDKTLNLNFRLENHEVESLMKEHQDALIPVMEGLGFERVHIQFAIREEQLDLTNMIRLESADSHSKIDVRI